MGTSSMLPPEFFLSVFKLDDVRGPLPSLELDDLLEFSSDIVSIIVASFAA